MGGGVPSAGGETIRKSGVIDMNATTKRRLKEIDTFIAKTNDLPKPRTKWERDANALIRRVRKTLQREADELRSKPCTEKTKVG
jgi:hypothetical protein